MFRFFLLLLFLPASALAVATNLPAIGGVTPGSTPAAFARYLFVGATFFVGAVAIIALIIGGSTYLTAAGNPQQASKGKEQVQSALLGLLLVFASVALLYTINPDLVRLTDPTVPIVRLPPPAAPPLAVPPGSCQLTSAQWAAGQICYDATGGFYPNVALAVQGVNCDDWGVAINITNASTGAVVRSFNPAGIFDNPSLFSFVWNPTKQEPACVSPTCDGTYVFTAVAGSGSTQTQVTSGDLVVTSQAICVVAGPAGCYTSTTPVCWGLRCSQGVADQIANEEFALPLEAFVSCVTQELYRSGTAIPPAIGRISAISDNSGGECINPANYPWGTGNTLTQCEPACTANGTRNDSCCPHDQRSAHYGGTACRGKSYAADFGLTREPAESCSMIHAAVIACNRRRGVHAWFHIESDHLHVGLGAQYDCWRGGSAFEPLGACTPGQAGPYVSDWCSGETQLCCDANGNITPMPASGTCP